MYYGGVLCQAGFLLYGVIIVLHIQVVCFRKNPFRAHFYRCYGVLFESQNTDTRINDIPEYAIIVINCH